MVGTLHSTNCFQSSSRDSLVGTTGKDKAADKLEISMMAEAAKLNSLAIRFQKFKAILETPNIDLGLSLTVVSWANDW